MPSIPARGKVCRSFASYGECKRAWVAAWRGPVTTDEMDCYMGKLGRGIAGSDELGRSLVMLRRVWANMGRCMARPDELPAKCW
ncbi:hypothetical protein ACS0TY_025157 [Phlomoides rotata]